MQPSAVILTYLLQNSIQFIVIEWPVKFYDNHPDGVSGSGKTTIGSLLARDLGWDFYDADDFHHRRISPKCLTASP